MKEEFICDYMKNDRSRHALNRLTQKTFSFNFESWYQNGFCENMYIPYSLIQDGELIANVSVNLMNMQYKGKKKQYIQLGTVMTDEKYRKMGYGKKLMEIVLEKYKSKTDGIYLYANDSAVHYYPRFGFQVGQEFFYKGAIDKVSGNGTFQKADGNLTEEKRRFLSYARNYFPNEELSMNNYGIFTFWTSEMDNIYYSHKLDAYISAFQKEEVLYLDAVAASHKLSVHDVVSQWGHGVNKVVLGFTPVEKEGFTVEKNVVEDCTFFYLGEDLKCIMENKLMFPKFSHA